MTGLLKGVLGGIVQKSIRRGRSNSPVSTISAAWANTHNVTSNPWPPVLSFHDLLFREIVSKNRLKRATVRTLDISGLMVNNGIISMFLGISGNLKIGDFVIFPAKYCNSYSSGLGRSGAIYEVTGARLEEEGRFFCSAEPIDKNKRVSEKVPKGGLLYIGLKEDGKEAKNIAYGWGTTTTTSTTTTTTTTRI